MPISLSNIFGKINDLYKKEDSVVAVDIGSSSIKVVQLRKDGPRILLETYGELSTGLMLVCR